MPEPLLGGGNPADPTPNDPAPTPPTDLAPNDPPADPAPTPKEVYITDENWRNSLPDDIKNDPSLQAIKDIPGLVKSYVHAQKLVGADKIQLPNKYDDGTQMRAVMHKLGLPEKIEDYEIKSAKEEFDEDGLKNFASKAHEFGILPKQAQALYDWYEEAQGQADNTYKEKYEEQVQADIANLKKEWGAGFDTNIKLANQTLEYFTEDNTDLGDYISQNYGHDTNIVKFLAKVGESLKEGRIIKEGDTDPYAITPDSAAKKVAEIRGDVNSPIYDKNHPQHDIALKELMKFTEIANR